ncbi:hypothetical protein Pedsa_3646 [Pseudopedobacter saltans DSM 12145]|uniref:Copper chaperone NosL n=1 Tax=Pseudopedobacter saltans (strain ATCC 51119 / DSM 12145 / JCM 21818 / CCUG 39354 / LMG 10337 / NBRC 100064 / NCIMB 13643) TaxID=762903 RepID=F0S501_PSESL|nr:hypothetical protein [Pseudopedobacter saltans]ADY54175.1 hypothetical protein Pedsa_3646 [Pseudopedobacter saltans DSM 12145]
MNQVEKKKTGLLQITKILSAICGIALAIVIFVPIWKIELKAPQYPEGLSMHIHANKLSGDVEIINGLNHYIGMRTLHANDFVEFTVLPYIFATFSLLGLLTAVINKRWFFTSWATLFFLFAIVAMVDFYIWEYDYGHNLDPKAPIQVPGMSYQPPLIGFKQLLNFEAFSIPSTGGWIMLGVGLSLVFLLFKEITNSGKNVQAHI